MSWPTILSTSIASACLVLGAIYLVIWLKIRTFRASLGFCVLALGVAAFALGSMAMMRSDTPERFLDALWWTNLSVFVTTVGLVAFVSAYFRTARPWLAHLTWIARFVTVIVNVTREPSFAYDQVIAMEPVTFLGERAYVADGVTSPWYWFGQMTLALAFLFPLDAAYRLWKAGDALERRHAIAIGAPASMFVLVAWLFSALTFHEVIDLPHLEFVPFLGLMLAMGYELSSDVIRAARLSEELRLSEATLRQSEQRMRVAADVARAAERSARELSGRLMLSRF